LQLETTFVVDLICICKKVREKPLCFRQQTLFTNNRPHAAGLSVYFTVISRDYHALSKHAHRCWVIKWENLAAMQT